MHCFFNYTFNLKNIVVKKITKKRYEMFFLRRIIEYIEKLKSFNLFKLFRKYTNNI